MIGRVVVAVPSSAAADELTIDWSAADRLDGTESIDPAAAARPVVVRADVDGTCPADPRFELDGRVVAVTSAGRCGFLLPAIDAGDHQLVLSAGGQRSVADMDLSDHLVVSIGDSVASGEGNPDAAGPKWLEPRCHRSLRSGAAVAARAAELGDRHSVITFVPLACSGATLDRGVLGPYDGIDPDARKRPLEPQVEAVLGLERPVEALLVSVGANDVHFGAVVAFCVTTRDCPNRHFDARHPRSEAADTVPTAAQVERDALVRLGTRYDALAARLGDRVEPQRVILVEYFDPLRDERGQTCAHALPGVSFEEARWAERNVLAPLNSEIRAAAARHGWRVVGGVTEAYRRHGICAGDRAWIRRPLESAVGQLALSGTLHPNGDGHVATATLIAPVLAATLAVPPGNTELPGFSHEGYVRWWWLAVAALVGAGLACAGVGIVRLLRRRGRT